MARTIIPAVTDDKDEILALYKSVLYGPADWDENYPNEETMKSYGKEHNLKTFDKVQSAISKDLSEMREHSAVSDLLNGLSKGNIKGIARHSVDYWTDDSVYCSEAFAHMFEAQFDSVRYAQMKKYFPQSLKKFEEMLGGLV